MLLNIINDTINGEDLENTSSYFDISNFKTSFPKSKIFSYEFIIFISQCYDVHTLLARMNIKLNIIGIIEAKFKKHTVRNVNINLNGYAIEHTPTEANCSSALLYIDNSLNYNVRCLFKH